MSSAAWEANSTQELSKFSKEQLNEARKKNAGKHNVNAGGWERTQESQHEIEKEVSTPAYAQKEGARTPASLLLRENESSHMDYDFGYIEDEESQLSYFAPEQDRPTHQDKRRRVRDSTPSAMHSSPSQNTALYGKLPMNLSLNPSLGRHSYESSSSYPSVYDVRSNDVSPRVMDLAAEDYRHTLPKSEEDMEDIQIALSSTRRSYSHWFLGECPPTKRQQSYSYQVSELRSSFAQRWMSLGIEDFEMPSLQAFEEPWRHGFKGWMPFWG